MDIDLFLDILSIDSTTGHERALADFLAERLPDGRCRVRVISESSDPCAPVSLMLSWGDDIKVVYCTHLDTVPPYIPPVVDGDVVRGRGACDAKGQIMAMYTACRQLADSGASGFALLLLHGEETGSFGAKEVDRLMRTDRLGIAEDALLVVGEPTDGIPARASKGTKAFAITIDGCPFHSGYPDHGVSAVDRFVDLVNGLRAVDWPDDPILGPTTWNVGLLSSPNPQNILSPRLTCRLYFRTTFSSDAAVQAHMLSLGGDGIEVEALGGDTPTHYYIIPGMPSTTVAFGSDAPQLTCFSRKMLCGPGSILVAHRPDEYIRLSDIDAAARLYMTMTAPQPPSPLKGETKSGDQAPNKR